MRWEHYVRRRDWTDIRRKLIPIIANAVERQLATVLPSEVKTDELTKRKLVMLKLAKENTFVKTLSMLLPRKSFECWGSPRVHPR
ncbi:MAG: hypothetical protein ACTS44_00480 [Candidatus Hodgkinia cicadicola]